MKQKLIEAWHALCRDSARQRLVIIALTVFCSLIYLVSAVSFSHGEITVATQQGSGRLAIPFGFRAVAMQSAGPLPRLQNGDRVDVIVDSATVLEEVLVVDVTEQSGRQTTVVLAVPVSKSAMIANAASLGALSLVLVG